jgi:hypothetical protein
MTSSHRAFNVSRNALLILAATVSKQCRRGARDTASVPARTLFGP